MGTLGSSNITAVLGPTNTGKTHLAVERLCAHSSGMIGFPLRLLAREVYDRVVALKGADQVALMTGEERILPPGARYFLCTAESMPLDRTVAFLALDEAQMGGDEGRGHIFTDRLLYARGRDETMILGSDSLRPLIKKLLPTAELVARPRFSTLSYYEAKKLSRLPKRSAIVAFSTEQVYAIGEMLRRQRGGVAVVMGSLSPRTRNAQVDMYQSGEVDYLVATDAIGMGLNMDISHVAFAGLHKFDGRRNRRLTVSEMAQIAGRAGRHQRDGSFGVVQFSADERHGFTPEEVTAIEEHSFPSLTTLRWRNTDLDFSSVSALIQGLDQRPPRIELAKADDAVDMAVLRLLSQEPDILRRAARPAMVQRLWAACQIPDYRKVSPEIHARLVGRIYQSLSEGRGTLPTDWIASEFSRLDITTGDIETIAGRIAGVRTWAYVSNRADWLDDPAEWAERARALENRLSDVLHERLMQRFVDRRTSVLLKEAGGRHSLDVEVGSDGCVEVDGFAIGTLAGFTFTVDPATRHADKRRVLAAAERALSAEMGRRVKALTDSGQADFALEFQTNPPHARLLWRNAPVATLVPGKSPLTPRIVLEHGAATLTESERARIAVRLGQWVDAQTSRHLGALKTLSSMIEGREEKALSGSARGLVVQLVHGLGCIARADAEPQLTSLSREQRCRLGQAGVRIGRRHVFLPALLKPESTKWRMALWSMTRTERLPPLPREGLIMTPVEPIAPSAFYTVAGYWPLGDRAIRVDILERLLQVLSTNKKSEPLMPPESLMSSLGLSRTDFARLMSALGYRRRVMDQDEGSPDPQPIIAYQLRPRGRRANVAPASVARVETSPFAVLAQLRSA